MKRILQLMGLMVFGYQSALFAEKKPTKTIFFEYKLLNKKESNQAFKTKKIMKRGYQPIEVKIANHSDQVIFVSYNGFNVQTVHADDVLKVVCKNPLARGLSFGLIGDLCARSYNKKIMVIADLALPSQFVQPGQTVTGMIFVQKIDLASDLTLQLENQNVHGVCLY